MGQYLIAYNNTQGFDPSKIHKVITGISSVTDWWHYLPNLYIISTIESAKNITDKIMSNFQGLLFVVIKLDMGDYSGVLSKDAWDWIQNKNKQRIKLRSTTTTTTSSSLGLLTPILGSYLSPIPKKQNRSLSLDEILKLGRR